MSEMKPTNEYQIKWKQNNKDKVAEHKSRYYNKNKEKFNEVYEKNRDYLREEIQCEDCYKTMLRSSGNKHKKRCCGYIDSTNLSLEDQVEIRKKYITQSLNSYNTRIQHKIINGIID